MTKIYKHERGIPHGIAVRESDCRAGDVGVAGLNLTSCTIANSRQCQTDCCIKAQSFSYYFCIEQEVKDPLLCFERVGHIVLVVGFFYVFSSSKFDHQGRTSCKQNSP